MFNHTRILGGIAGVVLAAGLWLLTGSAAEAQAVPQIAITAVQANQTVSFNGWNFPANQTFTVRMGAMWTQGIGGPIAGSVNTASGSFTATVPIPATMAGADRISIRLEGLGGLFSFNWFYNNTTGVTSGSSTPPPPPANLPSPGYAGIPTFSIDAVVAGESVTIKTNNFPANQDFVVLMGPMGTRGVGGVQAGSFNSGAGGVLTQTFKIPESLKNAKQVAIRAQTAHAFPYFAFNFFTNQLAGTGGGQNPTPPTPVYAGLPTFTVCSVATNQTVTVVTHNFPPNQTFNVTMGPMWSQGFGTAVGTIASGDGASMRLTFNIPATLQGHGRIAIRAQTGHAAPFFAYNWFFNNTATVC